MFGSTLQVYKSPRTIGLAELHGVFGGTIGKLGHEATTLPTNTKCNFSRCLLILASDHLKLSLMTETASNIDSDTNIIEDRDVILSSQAPCLQTVSAVLSDRK